MVYANFHLRTTSACAENTKQAKQINQSTGNYLRVRGEYTRLVVPATDAQELPPRARRIRNSCT